MVIILATKLREVVVGEGELIWPSIDLLSHLSTVAYLRAPQRGKTNRRYLHIKNFYYKKLVPMIMEAEKSQCGILS